MIALGTDVSLAGASRSSMCPTSARELGRSVSESVSEAARMPSKSIEFRSTDAAWPHRRSRSRRCPSANGEGSTWYEGGGAVGEKAVQNITIYPPTRGLQTQGDPFEPVKIGVLVDMDLGQLLADWIDPTILAIEDALNEGVWGRSPVQLVTADARGLPRENYRKVIDGYKWLVQGSQSHIRKLTIAEVSRLHLNGGSILGTSRTSLLDQSKLKSSTVVQPDAGKVSRVAERLVSLGVTHLLTIGGDDTALSARFVAEGTGGRVRVVHVPKTIDNDLPLPGDIPTFGFNTARHLGAENERAQEDHAAEDGADRVGVARHHDDLDSQIGLVAHGADPLT